MKFNNKNLYIIVTALICFLSFYYRYIPFHYFKKAKIQQLAQDTVMGQVHQAVSKQVSAAFPSIESTEKKKMINRAMSQVISTKKGEIKNKMKDYYKEYKRSDLKAPDYLIAADSYYYVGLIKLLIKNGKTSSHIINGTYHNPFMLAPQGHYYYFDLHPYIGLFIYKASLLFNKKISLINAIAFTSPILVILTLLIFLYYLYKIKIPPFCAFTTALLFSFAPMYFQRSLYGWFDTDPYNCLFPMLIIIGMSALSQKQTPLKTRFTYSLLNAAIICIYSFFWSGWTYIIACSVITLILLLLLRSFEKDILELKRTILLFSLTMLFTFFLIALFKGIGGLLFSFEDTYQRLLNFSSRSFNLWPDAFVTVGELKKISLQKMAVLAGGRLLCLCSLFSIVYLLIIHKENRHKIIVPLAFAIVPFFMTKNAERFAILLTIPVCFLFAYLCSSFFKRASQKAKIVLIAFLLFLSGSSLFSTYIIARKEQPIIYNETWNNIMEYIKNSSPENAVINTWWSPGHFITSMSERGAIIDGATLEKPSGYWISRALLTSNEKEALGILRMLDIAGNKPVELLVSQGFSTPDAITFLNRYFTMDPSAALSEFKKKFDQDFSELLYSKLYVEPNPGYVLVYNGLIESAIGLKFMGAWDFDKAKKFDTLIKEDPKKAEDIIKYNFDDNYIRFLWDFAGSPTYFEQPSYISSIKGKNILFKNGLIINTEHMSFSFGSNKKGMEKIINKLIFMEDGKLTEKIFNPKGKLSIILFNNENGHGNIITDNVIAESLLFKMYFFKGQGLENFEMVKHSISRDKKTDIYLYQIVWKR